MFDFPESQKIKFHGPKYSLFTIVLKLCAHSQSTKTAAKGTFVYNKKDWHQQISEECCSSKVSFI